MLIIGKIFMKKLTGNYNNIFLYNVVFNL